MNICQEGAWVRPPQGTEKLLSTSQPGPTCAGAGSDPRAGAGGNPCTGAGHNPCTGAGHGRADPSWGPMLGQAPSAWSKTDPSWRKQPRYLPVAHLTESLPSPFLDSSLPPLQLLAIAREVPRAYVPPLTPLQCTWTGGSGHFFCSHSAQLG